MSLTVFEVHLATEGALGGEALLSKEILRETQAEVMTTEQAKKKGFGGLPDLGPNVVWIKVGKRDAGWIQKALEANNSVSGFKVHHVD